MTESHLDGTTAIGDSSTLQGTGKSGLGEHSRSGRKQSAKRPGVGRRKPRGNGDDLPPFGPPDPSDPSDPSDGTDAERKIKG